MPIISPVYVLVIMLAAVTATVAWRKGQSTGLWFLLGLLLPGLSLLIAIVLAPRPVESPLANA